MEDFIMDLERATGERAGEVTAHLQPFEEDVYKPQTALGQSLAAVLRKKARALAQ
jgi:hypothetical protein